MFIVSAALVGPWLVLVIVGCGAIEVAVRRSPPSEQTKRSKPALFGTLAAHAVSVGGVGALAWEALKVGALSFGGGFVIIPLMEHDVVYVYHFMSAPHFLAAVALGRGDSGPGRTDGRGRRFRCARNRRCIAGCWRLRLRLLFIFVIGGGPHFDAIRESKAPAKAFLAGAGPAAIGASSRVEPFHSLSR